jgi:hypothetical protein
MSQPVYETDKETLGYVTEYRRIADTLGPAARVCELGVLNGLSLDMWKDMFPDGLIAGVDFNPASRWPEGTIPVVCGQTDPSLPARLAQYAPAWDLIVDDASHRGELTQASFDLLWPLIAPGGFYVIEDWFFGLPLWPSTGCWGGAPRGSAAVRDSYDPRMLHVVQGLLTRLDEPYRGVAETRAEPRDSDVASVYCQYGLAVVRKHTTGER